MRAVRLAAAAILTGSAVAMIGGVATAGPPSVQQFAGTLHLSPGRCHHGKPSGSYLAVTFGTRAIKNSSSTCADGAVTLLAPRSAGLLTTQYSSIASSVFDHRTLSLGTSSQNYFGPPRLYLVGGRVQADVRSVVVGYDGGQWSVGAEQANGHYDAPSHAMTLQWFSGESFVPASAATEVHLAGRFDGSVKQLSQGTTVQLGTASFGAGPASTSTENVATSASRHGSATAAPQLHHGHDGAVRAAKDSTTTGSPKTFLIAEVLVLMNLVSFVVVAIRRGRR
jgi:hypothetical protein